MDSYYVRVLDSDEPHFLESCSLCRKTLSPNSDIFMYRGDMAFCSQECRQEQIEFDEMKAKSWIKASSSRNSRRVLVITSSSYCCTLDVELNKEYGEARLKHWL